MGALLRQVRAEAASVVALRRILNRSRSKAPRQQLGQAWAAGDLLSSPTTGMGTSARSLRPLLDGPGGSRPADPQGARLGQPRHRAAPRCRRQRLREHLSWPANENDVDAWREQWRAAFSATARSSPPRSSSRSGWRSSPLHSRSHQDRPGHRDRERPGHPAHEGVPDRARSRPRRRWLRRHVRADDRLRVAAARIADPQRKTGTTLPRICAPTPSSAS